MLIRRSKAVVPTPLMGRDMLMIPRYACGERCQANTQVVSVPQGAWILAPGDICAIFVSPACVTSLTKWFKKL